MKDDRTHRPPGDIPAMPPSVATKTPLPRKAFDPASLKGGKHPGGKPLRGGGKLTFLGKTRGR